MERLPEDKVGEIIAMRLKGETVEYIADKLNVPRSPLQLKSLLVCRTVGLTMPISPAWRGILEQMFDEVLTKSSLDTAFTTAQRMVESGITDKNETRSFMVGFLSGAFLTEATRIATKPEKFLEMAEECANILLRRAWEIRDKMLHSING